MDKVRKHHSIYLWDQHKSTISTREQVSLCPLKYGYYYFCTDGPPDMEPHEDYEEENFNYATQENLENDAPNLTKLSEVAIQELDYYNFGKDVGSYNTA